MRPGFFMLVTIVFSHAAFADSFLDNALSYPVQITSTNRKDIAGSGFYLFHKTNLYFVTARHCLFAHNPENVSDFPLLTTNITLTSYPKGESELRYRYRVDLEKAFKNKYLKSRARDDVAVLQLGTGDHKTGLLSHVAIYVDNGEPPSIFDAKTPVKKFQEVPMGRDIYLFGFPSSLGVTEAFDPGTPLLRKGSISGREKRDNRIILDCTAFKGDSGSPVVGIDNDGTTVFLIGVLTQTIPFVQQWENREFDYKTRLLLNSGYSIAEPMDGVLDLMESIERLHSSQ